MVFFIGGSKKLGSIWTNEKNCLKIQHILIGQDDVL